MTKPELKKKLIAIRDGGMITPLLEELMGLIEPSEALKLCKTPRFMFAIVTEDEAGQTIQLFKTHKQANEFYEKLQDTKKETFKEARS
jgi:hypothetical protein